MKKELPTSRVLEVIQEAADLGVRHINYTGGEPLLHKDIFKILEHTIDNDIYATLFTNLTLLNENITDRLSKLDVGVYTSIDAPLEDIVNEIRGLDVWERTIKGLKMLLSAEIYPHVNITVSELNWRIVGDTIRFILDMGIRSISIIPAMPIGNALKNKVFISSEHFREAVKQASQVADEEKVTVSIWCTPFAAALTESTHVRYGNCRNWNVLDITPGGGIVLCDVLNIEVSNIREKSLREAYEDMLAHPLYSKIVNPNLKNPCNVCFLKNFCQGGCYARAYILTGEIDNPDPLCPYVANRNVQQ